MVLLLEKTTEKAQSPQRSQETWDTIPSLAVCDIGTSSAWREGLRGHLCGAVPGHESLQNPWVYQAHRLVHDSHPHYKDSHLFYMYNERGEEKYPQTQALEERVPTVGWRLLPASHWGRVANKPCGLVMEAFLGACILCVCVCKCLLELGLSYPIYVKVP